MVRACSVAAALVLAMFAGSPGVQAETEARYAAKPVHILVGFSPGGAIDIVARVVGQKLSESLGQPVVIDNKLGASGSIAAEYVARAAPDGYTLLAGTSASMVINPVVYPNLSYSAVRDFAAVSMLASWPFILAADKTVPITSVSELIAYVRAHPEKANIAGASASFQLAFELLKAKTGAKLQYVTYKGSIDAIRAVVAGEVLATLVDAGTIAPQLKSGEVRGLAVLSPARAPRFPDLPSLRESGVDGVEVSGWGGLFAPAATPPPVVTRLQDEVIRIMRLPEVTARLDGLSIDPVGNDAATFAAMVAGDLKRWETVARDADIRLAP
ncbi:MAG TPA: tripartite tricarboxylate transporter substrate binding protein [Alphaproteobacteria bacterium]